MHDYPETARFLADDEKREVSRRLKADRSSLADEFDMKYFWHAMKDWKIWVHMFITIGIYTPLYSISLFMPTIVKGLGYTANVAQLMTVRTRAPPPSHLLFVGVPETGVAKAANKSLGSPLRRCLRLLYRWWLPGRQDANERPLHDWLLCCSVSRTKYLPISALSLAAYLSPFTHSHLATFGGRWNHD